MELSIERLLRRTMPDSLLRLIPALQATLSTTTSAHPLCYLLQGYLPMELSIERLLRPSTPDSLLRLIPALHATALRYANKRSAASLSAQWLPPAAVAGAAAAAAGDASVGGSGGEAAVLNTRLGKLLGSMRAWWPHSCGADSCRRVSVSDVACMVLGMYVVRAWGAVQ
jgi:hypothetical protein